METENEPLRVGAFLDILNESFAGMHVAILGEVSGVEERRGVTYFSLKDTEEEGMLSCLIFRSDSFRQGIRLENGQEVIVEGSPNVWRPRGRLSFRVSVVRLAGEGALKKAYDELSQKLEHEGMFSLERKRPLPSFPRRIALITSREGAAIGDFMTNIGRHGFSVTLFDAQVEGKRAVAELLAGIRYFNARPKEWDVLVIIRGGGSLESLEAFNSEALVRAIAASKIPTLAGIGHEKDVSLSALAADSMVSTPTAVAERLGVSWEGARERILANERTILEHFRNALFDAEERLRAGSEAIRLAKEERLTALRAFEQLVIRLQSKFLGWCEQGHLRATHLSRTIFRSFDPVSTRRRIAAIASMIDSRSPTRLLARGYSVLLKNKRVVRGVSDIVEGDMLEGVLVDGHISARAIGIYSSLKKTI